MSKLMNVSSSPHARSRLTTSRVMGDVILALLPATAMGVYHFGSSALMTILVSIAAAVLTEFLFDKATRRENTITDCSAIVTGLLLALCLPNGVPLYIPVLGSVFAILFTKCCFGGLGHNFMNPALSGRCFLLISFASAMSTYTVDGVSSATPLADLAAGNAVSLVQTFLGSNNGVIGCSTAGLLLGGIYLLIVGGITWEIPASVLVSFTAFIALFGGHGFDVPYLLLQLAGGGIVMGTFFMATDPVTCPLASKGQLIYGVVLGILAAVFRVYGSSADSVSYAIIICNMFVPLIDEISIPVPFGYRKKKEGGKKIPAAAIALCVITLIAGVALSGVYKMTEGKIAEQQLAAKAASYREVCPDAVEFTYDDALTAKVDALNGEVYGTDFGKAYINEVIVGKDASGKVAGYVISASSGDGMEGEITMSVGMAADGTVTGISFTVLNETAGLGSLVGEDAFKGQFNGVKTDKFTLFKSGGASAPGEINGVSGATISSSAVVNAVNAAVDFFENDIQGGN